MTKKTGTWAEINLDNLEYNLGKIKKHLDKETKVCGVIKANAYGHGSVEIARFLESQGIDYLAVARLEEALELRDNNVKSPILCMGATNVDFLKDAIEKEVTFTVFSKEVADEINKEAILLNKQVKIHIKINSGMNRIGFEPNEESIHKICYINELSNLKIEGIFTHFAKADELDKTATYKQIERFKYILSQLKKLGLDIGLVHVSNSASIIDLKEFEFNMVRAGIAMYGLQPSDEVNKFNLKPLLKLKTTVIDSKIIKSGEGVSYGFNYIADKDTQILTLPIGYADGFPRTQKDGEVIIDHCGKIKIGKVVGNICMDQCMIKVDALDLIPLNSEVSIIDDYEGVRAEDIANRIDTINYEILCMISRRVSRVYKYKGKQFVKNYLF